MSVLDEARRRLDALQAEPMRKRPAPVPPPKGKPVTDAHVDTEMVARGWARELHGGFVGAGTKTVVPALDGDVAHMDYQRRRLEVRADLENMTKGRKPDSELLDMAERLARQLMVEKGITNKALAAREVCKLLEKRGRVVSHSALYDRLRKKVGQ